jgi:hypothetical protein
LKRALAWRGLLVVASSGGTVYGVPTVVPIPESHETAPSLPGAMETGVESTHARRAHGLRYVILSCARLRAGQTGSSGQGIMAAIVGALRGETLEYGVTVAGPNSVYRRRGQAFALATADTDSRS